MNYVIFGCGSQHFVWLIAELNQIDQVWSCFCDKCGDWAISTEDDASLPQIVAVLQKCKAHFDGLEPHNVAFRREMQGDDTLFAVVQTGEFTTRFGSLPELVEMAAMPGISV